jgi:hypothetical protein
MLSYGICIGGVIKHCAQENFCHHRFTVLNQEACDASYLDHILQEKAI